MIRKEMPTIIYKKGITLRDFLTIYDNWNGFCRINNADLTRYAQLNLCETAEWLDNHERYANANVLAFGFYDGELSVRIDDAMF